ncbi:MAG TPA: hypothetical protein VFQ68_13395 [Streptosporangiaceae bacterium]|nr:hypothetical protein [Streptosporangiaceae bacterium]
MGEHKKLTGVEVRSDGLVRLEREHGLWVAIDPGEVAAVAWNDDPETHPGQFCDPTIRTNRLTLSRQFTFRTFTVRSSGGTPCGRFELITKITFLGKDSTPNGTA